MSQKEFLITQKHAIILQTYWESIFSLSDSLRHFLCSEYISGTKKGKIDMKNEKSLRKKTESVYRAKAEEISCASRRFLSIFTFLSNLQFYRITLRRDYSTWIYNMFRSFQTHLKFINIHNTTSKICDKHVLQCWQWVASLRWSAVVYSTWRNKLKAKNW